MVLKAYKLNSVTGQLIVKFQQDFKCPVAYSKRMQELKKLGFVIGNELVH